MKGKFCGKTEDQNWIFGDLRHYKGDVWIVNDKTKQKVIPESVGFYINMLDKNGKEIYTGNLAMITVTMPANDTDYTIEQKCRVTWSDKMSAVVVDWGNEGDIPLFMLMQNKEDNATIEVVGWVFDECDPI